MYRGNLLSISSQDILLIVTFSLAVAVGTGPLGFGLVGIIPALEKFLTPEEGGPVSLSSLQIMIWSAGIAFFGVFFAIPVSVQILYFKFDKPNYEKNPSCENK